MSRLGKLFVIGREFEKKLHPEARKVFHTWNDAFQSQLQLDEINDDDLKFLSDYDKIKLKRLWEIPVKGFLFCITVLRLSFRREI